MSVAVQTEDMIHRNIVRFLLGRNPSAQNLREMAARRLPDNFVHVIASQEFAENVANPLIDNASIIHETLHLKKKDFDLSEILRPLPISSEVLGNIMTADSWRILFETILTDRSISSIVIERLSADAARANRYRYLSERLTAKLRNKGQAEAPSSTIRKSPDNRNVPPPAAEPDDQAGVSLEAAFLDTLSETDFATFKRSLDKVFSSKSFDIIAGSAAVGQIAYLDDDIGAYARMMLARTYIRLFLGESAFRVCEDMVERGDPDTMDRATKRRFQKTHAMAALRSGRAAMGKAMFRDLYYSEPADTDAGYSYADAISSENPAIAAAIFSSSLAHGNLTKPQLLFAGDFACGIGDLKNALAAYSRLPTDFAERGLLAAKIALCSADEDHWLASMNMLYEGYKLARMTSFGDGAFTWETVPPEASGPLVSVIMTAHNAQDTIAQSVQSVLEQSYANIEIFIIDDCSTDGTADILNGLSRLDNVHVVMNSVNVGTYCSKNRGIRRASGKFITFHDSDDWMHPERIARHVEAMHSGAAMSISNWFRMTETGAPIARRSVGGYLHKNPASTFFARKIFDRIGYFDTVRVGADTEMLSRVRKAYGHSAVVDMNDPLSVGLQHMKSLTQSGSTAFDEFRFSPVRSQYAESWVRYHVDQPTSGTSLNFGSSDTGRRFDAPDDIHVGHFEE